MVDKSRPHLEYGNAICHPRYIVNMKKIEGVQCRATKLVPDLKDMPYRERLQSLNFVGLETEGLENIYFLKSVF